MKARGPDRSAVRTLAVLGAIVVWAVAASAQAQFKKPIVKANAGQDALTVEDPFEGINRRFYAIHEVIDHAILRPLALGYSHGVGAPVRKVLHNFVTELGEPMVFGNDVLQLRIKRAAKTFGRFVVNGVIGIGGLFDPATKAGLPHHDNGFGTTLGVYGFKPGPYLFFPILGPSNFRDVIGAGMDIYSDPLGRIHYPSRTNVLIGVAVVRGLDTRADAEADLQQIESMGTDSYATLRSLYTQQRDADIRGEKPVSIDELPSFDDTPAPAAAPASNPGGAPAATDPGVAKPSIAVVPASPADLGADVFCLVSSATTPLHR